MYRYIESREGWNKKKKQWVSETLFTCGFSSMSMSLLLIPPGKSNDYYFNPPCLSYVVLAILHPDGEGKFIGSVRLNQKGNLKSRPAISPKPKPGIILLPVHSSLWINSLWESQVQIPTPIIC